MIDLEENIKRMEAELTDMRKQLESKEKFFKPINGVMSWYTTEDGVVFSRLGWNCKYSKGLVSQGNTFQTEAEAILERDRRAAKQRLKEAIFNLNGGHYGWEDDRYDYYPVLYNKDLACRLDITYKTQPSWFYLKSEKLCEKLVKTHESDLRLVLEE